jgi:hypothetical protein
MVHEYAFLKRVRERRKVGGTGRDSEGGEGQGGGTGRARDTEGRGGTGRDGEGHRGTGRARDGEGRGGARDGIGCKRGIQYQPE